MIPKFPHLVIEFEIKKGEIVVSVLDTDIGLMTATEGVVIPKIKELENLRKYTPVFTPDERVKIGIELENIGKSMQKYWSKKETLKRVKK
jgi:hypothetical protein